MTELPFATITELARAIRGGEIGPVELTEKLLDRIGGLDGKLHAFIGLTAERAMDEARAAEAALARGDDLGPLHGIPYAAKDLFDVAGEATTAGTHLLTDNIAAADCAAVRRLAAA
ncbi:MAG: amidase family protein, partial [Alphaproteobacteria bacterium]|nr:amidase family protein [Alphaproteobacteria bacterium]